MDANLIHVFTTIEKGFNIAGSIPVVSLFSGALRVVAGKVQALSGFIISIIGCVGFLSTNQQKWAKMIPLGNEFVVHGALNALRGLGEALLCLYTIVGNVLLLIPNMTKEEKFSPYFAYGTLSNQSSLKVIYI